MSTRNRSFNGVLNLPYISDFKLQRAPKRDKLIKNIQNKTINYPFFFDWNPVKDYQDKYPKEIFKQR